MSDLPDLEPGDVHLLWSPAPEPRPGGRRDGLEALLRSALAPYADLPPAALRFGREPRGRPFLLESRLPGLQFSLSDTVGGCLLAVANGLRIGVDLERADRRMPALRLARRYFASSEFEALSALPDSLREQTFLQAWTAKEAASTETVGGACRGRRCGRMALPALRAGARLHGSAGDALATGARAQRRARLRRARRVGLSA